MTQRVVNYKYGTGNPVLPNGSIDVRDGIDNLQSMDVFMNAPEDTYNQRDGEIVRTVAGMNNEFDAMIVGMNSEFDNMIVDINSEFDGQILNMGFTCVGTFSAGATLTNPRQTLLWDIADGGDGQEYGWSGTFPKVVPAASTPASTGGISVGAWISRFDPELRIQVRESLRRSYADAGYNLVAGSFEVGGTLANANDVLLHEASGRAFTGPAGTVNAGTDPDSGGFVDRSDSLPIATKVTYIAEAVGAVARSVADRLNDAVNAKDYGATGLGVADETAALLKAVKAVKFAGALGGTVYIPRGKYLCNLEVLGSDNVSIIGDRNGTILQSYTQDGWALTYTGSWIPSPFQAAIVSGITFVGVNKRGNGLQNNIGSGLELGYSTFNNCGIGYLSNATISYGIDNCFFYQCYIGALFTCRTSAGSGTSITYGPSNVGVTIKSAFFAQQPGDVAFNRTTFTACDCSVFIEQPDNPYSHDGGFRFYGGVMQNGVSGIIMRDIGGQLAVPVTVDSPWFEGMKPASTVVINGVSYNGCDMQVHAGVASVRNAVLSHIRVKDGATLYLDNIVVPSGVPTFDIDAGASVIGGHLRADTVSLPFSCKSIRSTRVDGTSGRAAAAIVGPHSTKSYRGAGDGSKLTSQTLASPYLLTKWGAGATVTNVADGVLDTQSCNEITDVAGGGVYLNYTTNSTGFVVMVVSMRAPAGNLDIRVTPDGAGAINGAIDLKLTPKWQTFAISGRGRGAGLGARFIFAPKTGSGTWRMSAIQVLEFPDEMSLSNFLNGSEFMV